MDILTMLIAFIMIAASFVGGFYIGQKQRPAEQLKPEPQKQPEQSAEETERSLEEENEAFSRLLGYNIDAAYGVKK